MKVSLCLFTLNAQAQSRQFIDALEKQSLALYRRLLIDSESDDATVELFSTAGFEVLSIPRNDFNHGATRQLAVQKCRESDLLIFMTQDAVLAEPEALTTLVACFKDERIGAAYGRQLPRRGAHPVEAHARLFNYPPQSRVKSVGDIMELGIKTAFLSNSFAVYRTQALTDIGGFPVPCPVSEDTFVAARMLLSGWKIAYCAEARVYHSHNFGLGAELHRYYRIGVFHAQQPWIRHFFSGAEPEGWRFVRSEWRFLWRYAPSELPSSWFRTVVKYVGYRFGLMARLLPAGLYGYRNRRSLFRPRTPR